MRYPYDIDGFYTNNPIDTDDVLPNTTSVDPIGIIKPKIENMSDPDSAWVMGLTPEEVIAYIKDAGDVRNFMLSETTPQTVAYHHERMPLTELEINSRKAAELFYITEIQKVDPGYVFPDKTKLPAFEWTYRQTIITDSTSVVLDYEVDADVLRELNINGTEIESFSWDKSTQTISGIVVNAGDKLKIQY